MNQQFIEIATIKVLDGGERLSDAAKVSRFVKAMTGGVLMPPIVVLEGATIPPREAAEISRYMTGGGTELSGERFLVDGQHRLEACRELGRSEIDAVLLDWTTYDNAFRRGFLLLPPPLSPTAFSHRSPPAQALSPDRQPRMHLRLFSDFSHKHFVTYSQIFPERRGWR